MNTMEQPPKKERDPSEVVKDYFKQEDAERELLTKKGVSVGAKEFLDTQKDLAEQALASSKKIESPVKLKELDFKSKSMLVKLLTLPAYKAIFGKYEFDSLEKTANAEISPADMDLLNAKMSDPRNRFENGEWVLGGQEAGAEISRNVENWKKAEQAEFEQAKTEFQGKFGNKLDIWKSKGFVVEDMDSLVKAYMADKSLDLVTTSDKKVAWGTPAAGFVAKL